MSESEKFEEQGRAYASLKDATASVATLNASLLRYAKRLEDMASFLKRFVSDPLTMGSGNIPLAEHVKADYRSLSSSSFESNVDELAREVKRAHELEEQIKKF